MKTPTLEQLFSVMPGHVYWLDNENIYQGCNDIQAKAFGLKSRQEVVGKRNHDLPTIDAAIADIWDKNNLEVMKGGVPKIVEEPSILENGVLVTVLSHKIPLRDQMGKIVGILGTSIDITELKKQRTDLEEELKQSGLALEDILTLYLPMLINKIKVAAI